MCMKNYSQLLNILVLELDYAFKISIFKHRKTLKIPGSLDFLGFLHTFIYLSIYVRLIIALIHK